jgi:hypothetical protein
VSDPLAELRRRFPGASDDFLRLNADRLTKAAESPATGSRAAPDGSDAPTHHLASREAQTLGYRFVVPLRVGRGQNEREHWAARHKREKTEKAAVRDVLSAYRVPPGDYRVQLVRIAPAAESRPLDRDNLQGGLKATRDAVAAWLGVDDRDAEDGGVVTWQYDQRAVQPRTYGVEISVWGGL